MLREGEKPSRLSGRVSWAPPRLRLSVCRWSCGDAGECFDLRRELRLGRMIDRFSSKDEVFLVHSNLTTVTDFGLRFSVNFPSTTVPDTGFGTTVFGAANVLTLST